jgi:hypothetical protein
MPPADASPPGRAVFRFLEIGDIAKKPQPAMRAQCLGEMPWNCRATAFKPDRYECNTDQPDVKKLGSTFSKKSSQFKEKHLREQTHRKWRKS